LAISYRPVTEAFNAVFRRFGRPERTVDEIRPFVGIGLEITFVEHIGEEHIEEGVRLFREHYTKVFKTGTTLLPGAREALDALDGRYRLALCSNKLGDMLRDLCDHLDVSRYFDAILGVYDVPHMKPHPDMLEEALRRINATADDTLYVGDTLTDVEFARSCDIPYVLVLGGTGTEEELRSTGPVALLESVARLPALLKLSPKP